MSLRTIAGKELRDVLREKSLLTAFAVQLFLAGFSALLLAGLTALHSPDALDASPDATVIYTGPGGFQPYLDGERNLDVRAATPEDALQAFREGRVAAVVQERYDDQDGLRRITLLMPDGELASTLLVTQMKALLLEYEEDLRQERRERLEIEHLPQALDVEADVPYGFVYATLMPLLVVTPVFLSGAIAGDALSQESRSRTLLILRSTPVATATLVVGKLLVPVVLVPVQVAVWLVLLAANGFPVEAPVAVVAFATMLGIFLTGTGGIIAALVRDESTTQAAYAVFVLGLAVFSLVLPRDPLNTIALLATGVADAAAWQTVAWLAVATAAGVAAAIAVTGHRIRRDML